MAKYVVLFSFTGETAKRFVAQPSDRAAVVRGLAVTGSGAFTRFETHELIEAADLPQIAERARQISYRPPGT